jgi:hypothetical protein
MEKMDLTIRRDGEEAEICVELQAPSLLSDYPPSDISDMCGKYRPLGDGVNATDGFVTEGVHDSKGETQELGRNKTMSDIR